MALLFDETQVNELLSRSNVYLQATGSNYVSSYNDGYIFNVAGGKIIQQDLPYNHVASICKGKSLIDSSSSVSTDDDKITTAGYIDRYYVNKTSLSNSLLGLVPTQDSIILGGSSSSWVTSDLNTVKSKMQLNNVSNYQTETTITGSSTKIPTSSAVKSYVDGITGSDLITTIDTDYYEVALPNTIPATINTIPLKIGLKVLMKNMDNSNYNKVAVATQGLTANTIIWTYYTYNNTDDAGRKLSIRRPIPVGSRASRDVVWFNSRWTYTNNISDPVLTVKYFGKTALDESGNLFTDITNTVRTIALGESVFYLDSSGLNHTIYTRVSNTAARRWESLTVARGSVVNVTHNDKCVKILQDGTAQDMVNP